ncbi:hypothetical protein CDAR_597401 [Caerostris darwini]|uniref:Uncharacterized protein n=1 Tax=Caerostris darwini TaxID=1538125 RepID=A0AAV4VP15_9ARAC|nr:hypothetical protein CDAR_597401 [Caerostris darwini]
MKILDLGGLVETPELRELGLCGKEDDVNDLGFFNSIFGTKLTSHNSIPSTNLISGEILKMIKFEGIFVLVRYLDYGAMIPQEDLVHYSTKFFVVRDVD